MVEKREEIEIEKITYQVASKLEEYKENDAHHSTLPFPLQQKEKNK